MNPTNATPDSNKIQPENTPLYIGPDVEFEGVIRHRSGGSPNDRAVITGHFHGDIEWNGILQVVPGGKVVIKQRCHAREMIVAGEITGDNEHVVVETGLLRLGGTAVVDVASLSLPPGGLEQERGSVVNARLKMVKDHPFAASSAPTPGRPALTVISDVTPRIGADMAAAAESVSIESLATGRQQG